MLPFADIPVQGIEYDLQVRLVIQEVGVADVYENGLDIMLLDIIDIGFLDTEQVGVRDRLFVGPVPFPDILLQLTHRRMEVDQDIRLDQLLIDDIEKLLIEVELLIPQVHFCEEQAFSKQIIRYGDALEKVFRMHQFLQLLISFGHKE